MSQLKNTCLYQKHLDLNARLVEFGGWNMPVSYLGIIEEHKHTRSSASLFDISHMGEFRILGKDCAVILDKVFIRLSSDLKVGSCRYNFLLNQEGGVLDDLLVYRLAKDEFYIVVNAATKDNDAKEIKKRLAGKCEFFDESSQTAKLDLQGPRAKEAILSLGIISCDLPNYYRSNWFVINGVDILISRTGYTGEQGYEFYLPVSQAEFLWDLLLEVDFVKPAGLGARDTLRLEMGYPLYGHEMNENTTPIESGFEGILKPRQGFVGDVIYSKKPTFKLIALKIEGKRVARHGMKVYNKDEKQVGEITSGSFSPSLQKVVALALIKVESNEQEYFIPMAKNNMVASVTNLPFYKEGSLKK